MSSILDLVAQLGIGLTVFASSNVDDLLLLAAFFSSPAFKARFVVIGQFLGIGALVFLSVVVALTSGSLPPEVIRLLGIVPLGIGLHQLIVRHREGPDAPHLDRSPSDAATRAQVLVVAGTTVANGGDNLGIYIPLFASSTGRISFFVVLFAGLTALWCWLAFRVAIHRLAAAHFAHHARHWLPLVLIGLGVYILLGTPTFG